MGLMAFLPTLALYVRERFRIEDPRELAFWAGLVYGVAPLTAALAGPVWGALGDRVGKKPMAIRANLAIAVTAALMPLAPSPLLLMVMRAVQGLFAGYVAPAMALVSQQAPRERHGLVIARLQVAMAAGSFLGPMLGGGIAYLFGRSALFWVTSCLSLLAAWHLHRRAEETPREAVPGRPSFFREMGAGVSALLGNPVFAWLLVLVLVLRLGQNMLEPFLALFVRELGPYEPFVLAAQRALQLCGAARPGGAAELGLELTIGACFAVMAVAQWVFTPWWGRLADRHGPLRCLAALAAILALVFAATATVATTGQFLVLRGAAAIAMAGSMTLAYAAASKRIPDERRTLAFSFVQSCMQLGFGLGPQLGGLVAAVRVEPAAGFRLAFLAAAALCALAGAGMFVLRRVGLRSAAPAGAPPADGGPASPPPALP